MPRVGYAIPQQGFRPRTNPLGSLRAIGLLGLGDSSTTIFGGCATAVDAQGNPVPCSDPSAAVWFDQNMIAVPPGTPTGLDAAAVNAAPSANGAPTGSLLQYQGTWQVTPTLNVNTIISRVSSAVRAYGLQVASSQTTGGALTVGNFNVTFSLQVTGPGFAQPVDAGSIVDHAYYSVVGRMPVASATALVSAPGSPLPSITPGAPVTAPGGQPLQQNWSQWLQSNALWVGLAVIAVAVGPNLVKKVL